MEIFDWKAWFELVDPISESLVTPQVRQMSATEVEDIQGRLGAALGRELSMDLPSDFEVGSAVFAQFITILPVVVGLPCSFRFSKGDDEEWAAIAVYRNAERLEFSVNGDSAEMGWALTSTETKFRINGTVCCTDRADRESMILKLLCMLDD